LIIQAQPDAQFSHPPLFPLPSREGKMLDEKRLGWSKRVCSSRVLKKTLLAGCSKTLRYKATEIPACGRQAEE